MSKRRAAAKRGAVTQQVQREIAEQLRKQQARTVRNKAIGKRTAAHVNKPHTGAVNCPCDSCAHARERSMHPDAVRARREAHRKRTVLRQPLPHKRRSKAEPSIVVEEFTELRKGQKVLLRGTRDWPQEWATVLKPVSDKVGNIDYVCVEVQRTKGSGWIITRPGHAMLEVKTDQIEGYRPVLQPRSVAIKGKRAQQQAVKDLTVYQVYRDGNGIAYMRVGLTPKGAQFVVNKGFSVELVELDANSTFAHMLAMRPVIGADIQECAKRLLHPLNANVTISTRAKVELEKIINNKELQMKQTQNVPATRPAKFAQVNAPAAQRGAGRTAVASAKTARSNGKAAASAAAAAPKKKAAAAAASANGAGRSASNDTLTVVCNLKQNPLREGTFCHAQVAACMQANGKTVADAQRLLDKSGANPNQRRLEVSWLQKKGLVAFK